MEPTYPIQYSFLDASFNQQYSDEFRLREGLGYATFLTLFIALLGLFGLATFMMQRRQKEIGIRKVLGASVPQILNLLAADFVKLIILAMILAIPFIWYFSTQWMQDFEYHIRFPWWVPLATGLGVIVLAFFTISSQTIKAATANPVESIRQE